MKKKLTIMDIRLTFLLFYKNLKKILKIKYNYF